MNNCKLKTTFLGYSNNLIKYYVNNEVFENFIKMSKTPGIIRIDNISSEIKFEKSRGNMKVFIYNQQMKSNINDLIDEKEYLENLYQQGNVISYLHNNDCIHRDLKIM